MSSNLSRRAMLAASAALLSVPAAPRRATAQMSAVGPAMRTQAQIFLATLDPAQAALGRRGWSCRTGAEGKSWNRPPAP